MDVKYNITPFNGGFKVTAFADIIGVGNIKISPYELSRNNIRGDKVKSFKLINHNDEECIINSILDVGITKRSSVTVQPFVIGNGGLDITYIFDDSIFSLLPRKKDILFLHDDNGSIYYPIFGIYLP